jgi:carboxyl-terminal processing protease
MKRLLVLFMMSAFFIQSSQASNLSCAVLPQLFGLFLRFHYVHKGMTSELREHTVEQFIKSLDPSKTILLESDVGKLKKDLLTVFTTANSGDCSKIEEVQKLIQVRSSENEAIAREYLNEKYVLNEGAELVTDPEKRKYPKDQSEKKKTLANMMDFQVSNYLLSKTKLPEARKNVLHSYEIVTKRFKEKAVNDRYVDFAEAFALALDPHSSYMSADTLEEFRIQMQLSLEGIGASLSSQDGFTVVEEVIPGGAADRTKLLQTKDKITAVAQDGKPPVSVIDMDLQDVVRQIRGKKGTKVTLTVLRQGETNKTFDLTIIRDKIDIKESAAKITYETKKVGDKSFKVGVIDLPSFYGGGGRDGRSSFNDMRQVLIEAKKNKVDGIVLDLSRNGGGLLDDAVRIAGLFLRRAPVVATKGYDQKVEVLADRDEDVLYNGPLVLLTSRLSASASEILAGALKDYRRALIVGGDHTFGKGTVQVVSDLPSGLGAMKVSTGMFFIPGGESTQHKGVDSDIELPSIFTNEDIGEKTMDYSLPHQKISTFLGDEANGSEEAKSWKVVSNDIISDLKKKSSERITKDPKFTEILKSIEDAKKNKGVLKLAELRKKAAEEDLKKKDDKEKKEEKTRKAKLKETAAPLVSEGVNIMVDWLQLSKPVSTALKQ